MKNTLKTLLLLFSAAITISMALLSCDSYERRMARFEKIADEFKASLGPNDKIITERIDSIAQKIFYSKYTEDELGSTSTVIMVHDYSNGETKQVLPNAHSIEDYEMCDDIWFRACKVVNDRLFLVVYSPCMRHREATGVFYVNFRDNTLHFVEFCYEASFLDNSSITINRRYLLGINDGLEQTKEEQYILSTSLSDEAYADNRWEQKRKEERLAEEWRKRDIERVIKFDYTIYGDGIFDDHIGNLNRALISTMIHTKVITVPNNKVWVIKRFTTSGYSHSPVLGYHKVENGYCENPYGPPVHDGQVFYPGQYMFSIKDLWYDSPKGHRTATIKFSEEMY